MTIQNDRDRKIDKLTKRAIEMDDICSAIYLVLILKKSLRFNELYRSVIRLNPLQSSGLPFVSRPSFNEHLRHLTKQKLVIAEKKGKQNVTYSLNKDAMSIFNINSETGSDWIQDLEKRFPDLEPVNLKEHYAKLTQKGLEQEIERDVFEILKVNLLELKSYVNYELRIDETVSDAEFWKFIGNPMYRVLEKSVAENCRQSMEYKKKFFEKIDLFIEKLGTTLMKE
jgi:DNA-binding transcriptional ArsR family regulator